MVCSSCIPHSKATPTFHLSCILQMTRFRVVAAAAALALAAYSGAQSIGVAAASAEGDICSAGSEEGSCVVPLQEETTTKASEGLLGGLSLGFASSLFFRKCG